MRLKLGLFGILGIILGTSQESNHILQHVYRAQYQQNQIPPFSF